LEVSWSRHFRLLCHYLFRSFGFYWWMIRQTDISNTGPVNLFYTALSLIHSNYRMWPGLKYIFFFYLGPVCISSGSTSAFKAYCATSIFWFQMFFIMGLKADKGMLSLDGNVQHVSRDNSALFKF
jgi:hypothetical protein